MCACILHTPLITMKTCVLAVLLRQMLRWGFTITCYRHVDIIFSVIFLFIFLISDFKWKYLKVGIDLKRYSILSIKLKVNELMVGLGLRNYRCCRFIRWKQVVWVRTNVWIKGNKEFLIFIWPNAKGVKSSKNPPRDELIVEIV